MKLNNGSLKLKDSSLKNFTIYSSNITLDFAYTSNQWIFSIQDIDQDALVALNDGYEMQIQLVRYQPRASKNTRTPRATYMGPGPSFIHKVKPSFPNWIGIEGDTLDPISADKKARININSQLNVNPLNINLTTWVNNMIKYQGRETSSTFRKFKGLRANVFGGDIDGQGYDSSSGFWFSKFRFIILINNRKYGLTNKELIINYYNAGDIASNIISNVVQTSNSISIDVS
jgi:hypothetical protein